jgi:hypothetical protein
MQRVGHRHSDEINQLRAEIEQLRADNKWLRGIIRNAIAAQDMDVAKHALDDEQKTNK